MSYLFRGRGQHPPKANKERAVTKLLPETSWNNDPLPSEYLLKIKLL